MSEMTPKEEMEILANEMYAMQMIDRWSRQDHETYTALKTRYRKLQNENDGLHPVFNALLQKTGEA
jgi:TusA-related sulfurtransferase